MDSNRYHARILHTDPNTLHQNSSQFVSVAEVSGEVIVIWNDFTKGRLSSAAALQAIHHLAASGDGEPPQTFSVWVSVHNKHASVFFVPLSGDISQQVQEVFRQELLEVAEDTHIQRLDLSTTDVIDYSITFAPYVLAPRSYDMFKCYEILHVSPYVIEWAYLMAARDWYDTATNNCLSFSKRFVRKLHEFVTGEPLLGTYIHQLDRLKISSAIEPYLDGLESRLSFFMHPE